MDGNLQEIEKEKERVRKRDGRKIENISRTIERCVIDVKWWQR
jgi:hypothetical protein